MSGRILICTDLDRTLLPNGPQPESAGARPRFRRLVARADVSLAYVTGRHRELVLEAIEAFDVPVPDFVIGDVGTSIYSVSGERWSRWDAWAEVIGPDWRGLAHDDLHRILGDHADLRLQEPEKQGPFKLSYYAPADLDHGALVPALHERLRAQGVAAHLIWSVDETVPQGLLDVLPASASKLHAIEFLIREQGLERDRVLFSGDSGNDLPVLVSPLQAVLVANATAQVRDQARAEARRRGVPNALYLARGGFKGMNGNYAAGILEGLAHYLPETVDWSD
jgi:HAD superfamily hydrolase (TIGR01484 family)